MVAALRGINRYKNHLLRIMIVGLLLLLLRMIIEAMMTV